MRCARNYPFHLVQIMLCLVLLASLSKLQMIPFKNITQNDDTNSFTTNGYQMQEKIFGHLHFMKTGGSSLNGMLALNYERVCGHKGWSFDSYLFNERANNTTDWLLIKDSITIAENYNRRKQAKLAERDRRKGHRNTDRARIPRNQTRNRNRLDENATSHIRNIKLFNRGRVPIFIGDERGYHDCDYISEERPWTFWKDLPSKLFNTPIELHVPCREKVDHLMSFCNMKKKQFNCSSKDLAMETKSCLLAMERFNKSLFDVPNLELKCYDYKLQFTKYMEMMTSKLQKKRFQSKFVHRETNRPRDKSLECIWKEPQIKAKVEQILLEKEYFHFCDACIKSTDNLFYNT